jgi:hypothetical protein
MPVERVEPFLIRSHRRVLEHCDALLARPLTDDQRSRLIAVRRSTEEALQAAQSTSSYRHERLAGAMRDLQLVA